MAGERENYLFFAKLADKAVRFDDMVEYMEQFMAAEAKEMTGEERNLLHAAYKKAIDARRSSLREVSFDQVHEQRYGNKRQHANIQEYHAKIASEINSLCDRILTLLDTCLIPSAAEGESKIFCLKIKGDFHSYLAEFKTGAEREGAVDSAIAAYKSAMDMAVVELGPAHPLMLGLVLNFSVFYYDFMTYPAKACALAKHAYDGALAVIGPDTIAREEELYKESSDLMHQIHENYKKWSEKLDGVGGK